MGKVGKEIEIGNIGNYYGGLSIRKTSEENGKECWWWGIEDWCGTQWDRIPDYLADALLKHQKEDC